MINIEIKDMKQDYKYLCNISVNVPIKINDFTEGKIAELIRIALMKNLDLEKYSITYQKGKIYEIKCIDGNKS